MKISSIISLSSLSFLGMAAQSGNTVTVVAALDSKETTNPFSYLRKKKKGKDDDDDSDEITYHTTTFLSGVKKELSESDIAIFDEISKEAYNKAHTNGATATKVTVTKSTSRPESYLASLLENSQLSSSWGWNRGFTLEGTIDFRCGATCKDDDARFFVSELNGSLGKAPEVANTLCAMLKKSGADNFENVHDCILWIDPPDDAAFVEKKKKGKDDDDDSDEITYHTTTFLSGVKRELSESDIAIFDEISKEAYNKAHTNGATATKVTVTKSTSRPESYLASLLESSQLGSSWGWNRGFTLEGTIDFRCGATCKDDDARFFVSELNDSLGKAPEVANTLCAMLKRSGSDNFENVHDCILWIDPPDDAAFLEKKKKGKGKGKDDDSDEITYHTTTFLSGVKRELSESDIAIFDEISKEAYNKAHPNGETATKVTVTKSTSRPESYLASLLENSQLGSSWGWNRGFTLEGTIDFRCGATCKDDDARFFVSELNDSLGKAPEVANTLCAMLKKSGADNFENVHDCILWIDPVEMEEMAVLEE